MNAVRPTSAKPQSFALEPDADAAVAGFSALGNQTRLAVFRVLVRAGADGLAIGDIHQTLGVPLSTLAHHLSALVGAGLVRQEKQGRTVVCRADYGSMHTLIAYLTQNCCEGVTDGPAKSTSQQSPENEGIES